MGRKYRIHCFIVFSLLVIVALQLMNHFMMFDRFGKGVCAYNSDDPDDNTLIISATQCAQLERRQAASDKHEIEDLTEGTKSFKYFFEGLLASIDNVKPQELREYGFQDGEQLKRILTTMNNNNNNNNNDNNKNNGVIKDSYASKVEAQEPEIQEICPEKFQGNSLDYGYPFFRKGFATLNCTQFVPIKDLITVVFDDLNTAGRNPPSYKRVLQGIAKYQTGVRVILISKIQATDVVKKLYANVDIFSPEDENLGRIWSQVLVRVKTKYVLIAPNLDTFDDDINLKRLIRVLSHSPKVAIVTGAYRLRNGHWDIGCQQALIRNYTLTLQGGYYLSHDECVFCDHIPGPWVARTKEIQFDERLHFGVFRDSLLQVRKANKIVASCPDVMFNIGEIQDNDDVKYLEFAKKHDFKRIVETNGRVRWYGCRQGVKHRSIDSCARARGLAVPPCDLENLADAIKLVMAECEKAGLFCELQEGTLLGAVKFNKVLPWERDADLTFLTANYTAFKRLAPIIEAADYSISFDDESLWCCVDNRKAGGKIRISVHGWTIEMYGQHIMDSEMLVARGEAPTKVDFAGQMVTVVRNPGLFARNRYGKDMYKHQEHWLDRGEDSGWKFYDPGKFEKCPKPGDSGCLSQYSIDGNMQFDRNICPCSLD